MATPSALIALLVTATVAFAGNDTHIKAELKPIGGSGVSGFVQLHQLKGGETSVDVHATGLTPGHPYRSLVYDADNTNCSIEPYATEDVVGNYTGNPGGKGNTHNDMMDDLDEIGSVSVRDASQPFSAANPGELLACTGPLH
jgi:hypothetical protein